MPLIKSASPKAVGENIKREVQSGRPRKQAIAIALDVQRRAKMAAGGIPPVPFTARSSARSLEHSGMVHSPTGGRSDMLPTKVQRNSFVVPADIVSGIGGGNSMAGANGLNKMLGMGPYGSTMPHPRGVSMNAPKLPSAGMMKGRRGFADGGVTEDVAPVDVSLSGGEFVVPPDVIAANFGDIDHGHSVLHALVDHVRKSTIKTLRKLPKPKQ